jgi:DNA repair photolyase
MNEILYKIKEYDKNSKIIKLFNPNESRSEFGCPPRLCVNTFVGCYHQCKYCYNHWMKGFDNPHAKQNFKKNFLRDVDKVFEWGLNDLVVSISNSTDPFQEALEDNLGHTLFALEQLNKRNMKILILTKNPVMLLRQPYFEQINNDNVCLEITVAFSDERFESNAPPNKERIKAIFELRKRGLTKLGVRLDPLIPEEIGGQTEQELELIIKALSDAGVEHVISKVFRLVGAIGKRHKTFFERAKKYYLSVGSKWHKNHYILPLEKKQILLERVLNISRKHAMTLSTCYEDVKLQDTVKCDMAELKLGVCKIHNL